MRYYMLLGLVTAAGFAATAALCSALLTRLWPRLGAAVMSLPTAGTRARRLALLRLTPFTAGLAAALIVSLNFLRYEPRGTTEEPSLVLLLAAALAVALTAGATIRVIAAARTMWQCRRLVRTCGARSADPGGQPVWIIDTEYPVAAVMGLVSTRVLLSRRILSECTAAEVASIVRHEIAHIQRLDNLVQGAMRFLPDPLAHTATGRAIQAAWATAAEEAADDLAAQDPVDRTDLASALVRVAGMADRRPPRWMPALTFFEPATVESRVRRLLMSEPSSTGPLRWAPSALLACGGAFLVSTEAFGLRLHALMELAVRALP